MHWMTRMVLLLVILDSCRHLHAQEYTCFAAHTNTRNTMLSAVARHGRPLAESLVLPFSAAISSSAACNAVAPVSKPNVMKEFSLYRFNPEVDAKPYYKKYKVDINEYVSEAAPTPVVGWLVSCAVNLVLNY